MSYTLKKITKSDLNKIVSMVDADSGLIYWLDKIRNELDMGGHNWAVDEENCSYLLGYNKMPMADYCLMFFFKGELYLIYLEDSFSLEKRVTFNGKKPSSEVFEDFKESLTAAFAVHGPQGSGNVDDPIFYSHTTVPVFAE